MYRSQDHFQTSLFNDGYNMSRTAFLTNSINLKALKTFNKWGGLTYKDILNSYPKNIIEECWNLLSTQIIENYQMGKGTYIKGFGTFTFTNIEINLEGTTNQYERDIKKRRPLFLVSNEFIDYLKPGIYTEKSGLMYYTQNVNNNVSIVKVNYSSLSYGMNMSKEEYYNIVNTKIKIIGDEIRRNVFKGCYMKNLGIFLVKGSIFGMKFNNEKIFEESSLKTQKYYHIKKNLNLYMETKDSDVQARNIFNIDKFERSVRPKNAVLTHITESGDEWLRNNCDIDVKKIADEERVDLNFQEPKTKKEYLVDQRYYRSFPIQNLGNLKISQDILEGILRNKDLILRYMKNVDRHGNGLIPKYDFINAFHQSNSHKNLRIELIEKITDLYLDYDPSIRMIYYNKLIQKLCEDINKIINEEYKNFPIEKYKGTINDLNVRSRSAYAFSSQSGNLDKNALSTKFNFNRKINGNLNEVKNDILRIKKIIPLIKKNTNKMVSYLELMNILQGYMISIGKVQILKLLKFFKVSNPNAFNLRDLLMQIYQIEFGKDGIKISQKEIDDSIEKIKNLLPTLGGLNYLFQEKDNLTYEEFVNLVNSANINPKVLKSTFEFISKGNKFIDKNTYLKYLMKENLTEKKNKEKININEDEFNFSIDSVKIILNKIYANQMDPDQYFDHLLTYNMVREKNIIHKDEFERVFQLEKFDFSVPELNSLFKFFDFKNDGIIDRQEFVRTLKNIPYPITTFHNFIKNTKLSIEEACYKMGIDLFSGRVENELKNKVNRQSFNLKVKNLSNTFDKEFLYSLYNAMNVDNKHYITVKQLIDYTNIYGDEDYKNINSPLVHKEIITVIQNSISFDDLKNKFEKIDLNITQKLPLDKFITTLKEAVNNKINDKNLLRFLRMHRLIDFSNIVSYHQFIMIVYDNYIEDVFMKVIEIFKNFLETECNNDLFLFLVKINNMCNSSSMKRTVEAERLYAFFRPKLDYLSLGMINRFDYNNDGIISFEDLENIIKKYIDPHFFDNKKEIMMKLENDNKKKVYDGNKRVWNLIKIATNKMNLTDEKLFYFLDKNKDTFIGKIEFLEQIPKLKLPTKLTQKQLLAFYNYLDDFMNEKVNINIFLKKFKIFETDNIENDEQLYKGNFVIENILLGEFAKWYNRNMHLSDTEIYSILDRDNDGIISSDDIKNFAINILRLAGNELNDLKILHFMNAISLTKNNNLVLADIQNLCNKISMNELDEFYFKIKNYCNIGVNKTNKDPDWLNEVINKLGDYISEKYPNNINQFYKDININDFKNTGKGVNLNDFKTFIANNPKIFESFHIEDTQIEVLFKHISNGSDYLTLQHIKQLFDSNKYSFYENMHNDIYTFINQNFPNSIDAFRYFHDIKPVSTTLPTYNDKLSEKNEITIKDFFNGINKLFPQKYETNTVLHYISKYFPNSSETNIIKYNEFSYLYFNKIEFNNIFSKSKYKSSKILTTRPKSNIPLTTLNSPFIQNEHKGLETPFDNDPLEKIKRCILSSTSDYKKIIKDAINQNGGLCNKFEFRNMIKKLELGLTNIEIEDIITKSGLNNDGRINLIDFYKFINNEEQNLYISKNHILNQLKEIKTFLYNYYANPRLAFEMNSGLKMDFDTFKKIIYDLYSREQRPLPNYNIMKCIYDYIDVRKDGVIDLNEWNKVFAQSEGSLDVQANKEQLSVLRKWETSNDIINIYKLISKNKKIIRENARKFSIAGINNGNLFVMNNNMINVLKNVLVHVNLSYTQWNMIVSLGDRDKSGFIDVDTFIKVIDANAKVANSHPVLKK